MSVLTTILPFIIIIAFIAIVFYLYKLGKSFFTIKITHWLLSFYLFVLVIATALVPIVTESKRAMEKVTQEDQDEVMNRLYNHLQKGKIDSIEERFIVSEQVFEHYQKNSLQITSTENDFGTSVYIEIKPENDGKIETFVFRSSLIFNEMDFSDLLESSQLEKTEDSLVIDVPDKDIHVSILGPSLPVRQLTKNSMISHTSSSAEEIVYLRVPKNINITSSEGVFLHFVDK